MAILPQSTPLQDQYNQILLCTGCKYLVCLRNVFEATLRLAIELSYDHGYDPDSDFGFGDYYYGPALDDNVIQQYPSNAVIEAMYQPIPLLTNHDGQEGVTFSNTTDTTEAEATADLQILFPQANTSFFKQLLAAIPCQLFQLDVLSAGADVRRRYDQLLNDADGVCDESTSATCVENAVRC